jgi:hypothetical protein
MTDTVENQTEAQVAQPEATEAKQESFDLTINDLTQLRAIVDVASQRGAFKASELAAVGTAYNKLNGFLEQVAKQGQQANG